MSLFQSSSEVKALFSDINSVATKHITEISKVIMFQTRHQKRLLTYYQKRIPYQSPMSISRHSSATNITENMDMDERSLFRKPNTAPRLSLISPPQDGRMGTVPHRPPPPPHNMLANHSARSATVSRFQGSPMTQDMSYGQSSGWKSPFFQPLSSFRHNMSSMVSPPPNRTHT
ncbi:putative E3 SUMO-protein ligase [Liparis tanakae]|uniref:Putative E3 SUMO-protein ligase n=1 Tax=Liparis tanakae TaxID=230148 RepID=A0A4Z2EY80_9TELE|nr:putative E3 SUMO-protein ligase [Liparis tanakae]